MTNTETTIFFQRYNVCPRYPNGTAWEVVMRARYCSCAWNMESFSAALAYLRDQYRNEVERTKANRNSGDEHCEREFHGHINGPGGRIDWRELESLVTGKAKPTPVAAINWTKDRHNAFWSGSIGNESYSQRFAFGIRKRLAKNQPTPRMAKMRKTPRRFAYSLTHRVDGISVLIGIFDSFEAAKTAAEQVN